MIRKLLYLAVATGLLRQFCKSLDQRSHARQVAETKADIKVWEAEGGNLRPSGQT